MKPEVVNNVSQDMGWVSKCFLHGIIFIIGSQIYKNIGGFFLLPEICYHFSPIRKTFDTYWLSNPLSVVYKNVNLC